DNVAPCLLGGVRAAVVCDSHVLQAPISVGMQLTAVCFVPELTIPTPKARGLLPESVTRADAVFNVGRASLMVAALTAGRPDLLAEATRDRLHQPFRLPLFPAGATLLQSAMDAGALGAFVSGAGPTILALCSSPDQVAAVSVAFEATSAQHEVPGSVM